MIRKLLYSIYVVLATFLLMGCVPDDGPMIGPGDPQQQTAHQVEIHLGVVSNAGSSSRAGSDYSDVNMQAGELMRNWLVVIVDNSNRQIIDIKENETYASGETERSQDSFWERMSPGTYTFYSFANISKKELGIGQYKQGDTLPTEFFEKKTCPVKIPSLVFADDWSDFEIGYFTNGIPMSNKQVVIIGADTKSIDLEVIRMLAKVQLQLTNNTTHDITFKGLTLSDITPNTPSDGGDNLMLLPGQDSTDVNGVVHVGAVNLATQEKQLVNYSTKHSSTEQSDYVIKANRGYGDNKTNICFYVNESMATDANKYIVLQLQTQDNDNTSTQVNRRLAMLDWKQICRNDYRIIPIKLDDYAIDWEVEAFTPIGVLPEVEDDGDNLTIHFGYYGEFHIKPKVRQLSTGYHESLQAGEFQYQEGSKDIFDTMPVWNPYSKYVEGEMANQSGTSLFALRLVANKENSTETIVLTRKVRFVMDAVNLSSRSASGNKLPICKWQKVEFNP